MRRRKVCVGLLFALALGAGGAFGQTTGTGIGVILGEPTGIAGKYWVSGGTAFAAAAAWSFVDEGAVHLHADYLYHRFVSSPEVEELALYYGIGGRMKFARKSKIGVRFPIGLSYLLKDHPFDVFGEFIPVMELAPATDFSINGALGFRFFF